jgi:hypothetical protein
MQDLTLNLLHVTNSPYQLFGGLISQLPNTGCYLFCEASRSWHCTVLRLNDVDPLPPTYIPLIFEEDMTQETTVFLGAMTSF